MSREMSRMRVFVPLGRWSVATDHAFALLSLLLT